MTGVARAAPAIMILAGLVACQRLSDERAVRLVEEYNRRVVDAYRAAEVRGLDEVVGPGELRKLAGLIGTRLDAGINLDAELTAFAVRGVRREGEAIVVETAEHWRYADRRIGSGEQVGEASEDDYVMEYVLTRSGAHWLVSEIRFAAPPQVGRTQGPFALPGKAEHGLTKPRDRADKDIDKDIHE